MVPIILMIFWGVGETYMTTTPLLIYQLLVQANKMRKKEEKILTIKNIKYLKTLTKQMQITHQQVQKMIFLPLLWQLLVSSIRQST